MEMHVPPHIICILLSSYIKSNLDTHAPGKSTRRRVYVNQYGYFFRTRRKPQAENRPADAFVKMIHLLSSLSSAHITRDRSILQLRNQNNRISSTWMRRELPAAVFRSLMISRSEGEGNGGNSRPSGLPTTRQVCVTLITCLSGFGYESVRAMHFRPCQHFSGEFHSFHACGIRRS